MRTIIFFLIFLVFISCRKKTDSNIEFEITDFPVEKNIESEVMTVPPVLLAPENMCISDNKLIILSTKKDTLIDVFQLPECKYLFSDGIKGAGPNDLPIDIDPKFIQAEEDVFRIFSPLGYIKEYTINNNKIVDRKKQKINTKYLDYPVNGFKILSDNLFICTTGINDNHNFEFVQINSDTGENHLFGSSPDWINNQWVKGMEPFVYVKNTVVHPDGTKFASFYGFFKRWRIYDAKTTQLIRDISVHVSPYSKEVEEDILDRTVYYRGYPRASEKYIYALCKNQKYGYNSNENTELQVWNWDGNPVAILNLNHKIDLFAVSEKEKRIYALNRNEGHEDKIYVYTIPVLN
ncbi:MAG: TolB-like 6-bladed beta-propeller domain-containing protein [Dysgonamonadaceae bacterium]|jgi:hypothetical protein|nr:TolB-like 6-bladed beta-propeller domain-containing protein [Dysgonamonadaceae bacterium]